MEIREYYKKSVEIVEKIDKKFKVKRDAHLSFAQLIEEVGELAKAINLKKLRHEKLDKKNLEEEFADVYFQLAELAKINHIDIEKAIKNKIEILKKKHCI